MELLLLVFLAKALHLTCAKELKYPEGVKPGDQISGSEGEYFRYKSVFVKPPDDDDRMESLRMAGDVMCSACEVMLQNLIEHAESLSEDHIMDQLDGELAGTVEYTDNPQENRVNMNRRGCNKHFKDELLLKGYAVRKCKTPEGDTPNSEQRAWCLERLSSTPAERDVDTYSTYNEAAFYACENTISRYGQEIAAYVADRVESGAALSDVVQAACREAAKCKGGGAGRKTRQAKSAKKRRRRGSKTLHEGDL
mmetsp:Transcript_140802/g.392465  ORF Transcript_140802/g.392465 Transcript_140802/m.392465 type:complete len:252 (-) Transcript_140802:52-807(-)